MGLLKTGMKAVVAVNTADVIHERIQRRQQEQLAAYGHSGGIAAAGELWASGVLTDAEFEAQKARILNG